MEGGGAGGEGRAQEESEDTREGKGMDG